MQTRGVANPNTVLASGNVSLVLVQGILRPGIQKGDHFDVEVRVPSQSETTSLRGGYLLETRLTETAVLGNQVHHGNLLALAKGPVMVDPTADPKKDRIALCRGRILGGGVCLKSRPLGLVLTARTHQERATNSVAQVANAVNKRFHTFQNGVKTGMAKAKTDQYIELTGPSALQRQHRPLHAGGPRVADQRIGARADAADRRARRASCSIRPRRPRPRCNWRRSARKASTRC